MLHHGSVIRLQNKEYKYKFYIFVYFFGTFFVVFYHKVCVFIISISFFDEFINQSETGTVNQNLSVELYKHNNLRNPGRCRTLMANSTQRYFKYYYKKEVLHNSKTFSSLFLDLNIFAQNKSRKWTKVDFFSYFRVYTNESYLYFDFLPEEGKERFEFTVLDLKYFTLEM